MKLKIKLISSLVLTILVMSMLVVGVFAVKNADFKVGGNITFSAKGVYATISKGTLTNCSFVNSSDADLKLKEIKINTDKTDSQINSEFLSWQGLNLKFNDDLIGNSATLVFSIKNDAIAGSEERIDVSVATSSIDATNANISLTNSKNKLTTVLEPQEEVTYTITFAIEDRTANASVAGFEIDFNLSRLPMTYADALARGMDFDFNEDNTASVKQATDVTPTGKIVIPRIVIKDGKEYTVTSIANNGFQNCDKLTFAFIPSSVTSIGDVAFAYCSGLTSITIPDSVKSIGRNVFSNCTSLTSATIGNGVTFMGWGMFNGCSNLTNVIIGSRVTTIGNGAFNSCKSLTKITIPNSVTIIGSAAFFNCTSLTIIIIPESVKEFGDAVFYGCSELTTITIKATTPPTLSNTNAIPANVTQIFVPSKSIRAYKTATNWSSFADKIYPEGGNYSETITIPASSWNTETNTVTVEAFGSTTEARNIITWNVSSGGVQVENTYGLRCTAQGTMSLTFSCETIPTEDVEVSVRYMLTNY